MESDSVLIICVTLFLLTLIILFAGDPDLMDATISNLQK